MKRDDKQDLTALLANTVKWVSNYKPALPTEPDNFIVMNDSFITQNAICTPSGHYLISSHRHDYKLYKDANGSEYMVDGGVDYVHRAGPLDFEELTINSDDPFEDVRNKLLWGSYGKSGKDTLKYIRLKDMEEEHIANVIQYLNDHCIEGPTTKWRIEMMQEELRYRKLKLIGE